MGGGEGMKKAGCFILLCPEIFVARVHWTLSKNFGEENSISHETKMMKGR